MRENEINNFFNIKLILYDLYHASKIKKCKKIYCWGHNADKMDHLSSTHAYVIL